MHGALIPTSAIGQSLDDLAAQIKREHQLATEAATSAIAHAIAAGRALVIAKATVKHGEWLRFLKRCDIGERRAQQYAQLATLAEANPHPGTDLSDLTIKGAIRHLAPPKPAKSPETATAKQIARPKPPTSDPGKRTSLIASWRGASQADRMGLIEYIGPETHVDIIKTWRGASQDDRMRVLVETWRGASQADRKRFIECIGPGALLAALPENWVPLIEQWLADRRQPPAPGVPTSTDRDLTIPADLSIPKFLRREIAPC